MVKPNEPCYCQSGKKYKKCCFQLDEAKRVEETVYMESEMMAKSLALLQENFPDLKFKNVSDKLSHSTYRQLQLNHMSGHTCIVAEKTKWSDKVFSDRDKEKEDYDLLVMYNGAYRIMHGGDNIRLYIMSLKSFFENPSTTVMPEV